MVALLSGRDRRKGIGTDETGTFTEPAKAKCRKTTASGGPGDATVDTTDVQRTGARPETGGGIRGQAGEEGCER